MKTDSLEVQRLKHTIRYLKSEIKFLSSQLKEQKKLHDVKVERNEVK